MPKQTFINLDAEKRDRFLSVADTEFALHNYAQASISRIVAELGIAKGSLYQYFDDKQDLYLYLIERAATTKFDFVREESGAGSAADDFFTLHARLVLAGAKFDLRYPRFSLILYRAMNETSGADSAAIVEELKQRSADFLRQFVELATEKGEIRTDIDIDLAVHMTNTMTLALGPYLKSKYGYTHLSQLHDPDAPLPFTMDELERDVQDLVGVMRSGLGPVRG